MNKRLYRHCQRKRKYSQRNAVRVVQKMNERQQKRVHSYYCDFCKQYHIGRTRDGNENLNQPITGAGIYSEITESDVRPFESLSPEEKLIYNLLAETVEEVLEDKKSGNINNS